MTDTYLRSPLQQARGVIGQYPDPGDRYIFVFDDVQQRTISMIAVTKPLKVQWLVEGTVMQTKVLRPWIGRHTAPADVVIEAAVKQPRTRE